MRFLRDRGRRAGFTLLEVLVALAVMAIAGTLILQLFAAKPAQHLRFRGRNGGLCTGRREAPGTSRRCPPGGADLDRDDRRRLPDGRLHGRDAGERDGGPAGPDDGGQPDDPLDCGGRERSLELKSMKLVDRMLRKIGFEA